MNLFISGSQVCHGESVKEMHVGERPLHGKFGTPRTCNPFLTATQKNIDISFGFTTRVTHAARQLALALILFSTLTLSDASHAASRVFYDGFEDGTTNKWQQADARSRCQVVTAATDGIVGPFAGTRMARCNWDGTRADGTPDRFQTLVTPTGNYTDEFFIRVRFRMDQNIEPTPGSSNKFMRLFYFTGTLYHDLFADADNRTMGILNKGAPSLNEQMLTYYGDGPKAIALGDVSATAASWHKLEYWIKQSTGAIRVWHDGLLVRDDSGYNYGGIKWPTLFLVSNWSATHDATNHIYFDEVEIFSDRGTGASGSMSDATISGQSTDAPKNPQVQ